MISNIIIIMIMSNAEAGTAIFVYSHYLQSSSHLTEIIV